MKASQIMAFTLLSLMLGRTFEDPLPSSLRNSLILEYLFTNSQNETSINTNHAIQNPNLPLFTESRHGIQKSAIYFDGMSSFLQVSFASLEEVDKKISISVWIWPNKTQSFLSFPIIDNLEKQNSNWTGQALQGNYSANGTPIYNFILGCGASTLEDCVDQGRLENLNQFIINAENWNHLLVMSKIYENQYQWLSFYVNGSRVAQINNTATKYYNKSGSNLMSIGMKSGMYFTGKMDDLRIQNRLLTDNEINALWMEGCNSTCKECANYNLSLCSSCYEGFKLINGYCIANSLKTGLLLELLFNGFFTDTSDNKNEAFTYSLEFTRDRNELVNNAFYFKGDAQIQIVNGSKLNVWNAISISAWIKMNDTQYAADSNYIIQLLSKSRTTTAYDEGQQLLAGQANYNPTCAFQLYGGCAKHWTQCWEDNTGGMFNKLEIKPNQWNHIVATSYFYNSRQIITYQVNGSNIANLTNLNMIEFLPNGENSLQIGKFDVVDIRFFTGVIDDLRIWNRTISSEEVKALQMECPPGFIFNQTPFCTACAVPACLTCDGLNRSYCLSCYFGQNLSAGSCIPNSLRTGLLLEMLFNGDANDTSGCENNGTVVSAYPANDRFNFSKSAYFFDGNTSYIWIIDGSKLNVLYEISVSLWLQPFSNKSASQFDILDKGNSNDQGFWQDSAIGYKIQSLNNSNNFIVYLNMGLGQNDTMGFAGNYSLNAWNHLVYTLRIETQKVRSSVYLNGSLQRYLFPTANRDSFVTSGNRSLQIGKSQENRHFCGIIDDIRIWNRSLTIDEVKVLFNEFPHICNTGCTKCIQNSSFCQSCEDGQFFLNNSCYAECPDGYYNSSSNSCSICSNQSCKSCFNNSFLCKSCFSEHSFFQNLCLFSCPAGFFKNNSTGLCSKCNSTCKTCSNNESFCVSCNDGYYFLMNWCYNKCPEGYYNDSNNCSLCNSTCKTCSNSSGVCDSCQDTFNYLDNLCYANNSCPEGWITNSNHSCSSCNFSANRYPSMDRTLCLLKCEEGQQQDSKSDTCVKCAGNCTSCQSFQLCISCLKGFVLSWNDASNSYCEKPFCLSNQQRVSGFCQDCPASCTACSMNNTCTKCFSGFGLKQYAGGTTVSKICQACSQSEILMEGVCVQNCPDGKQLNKTMNFTCQQCHSQCGTCKNAINCTSCKKGMFLIENGTCLNNCSFANFIQIVIIDNQGGQCARCNISNCDECLNILQCQKCSPSYYLMVGECVTKCPTSEPPNTKNECIALDSTESSLEIAEFSKFLVPYLISENISNGISFDSAFEILDQLSSMQNTSGNDILDNIFANSKASSLIAQSLTAIQTNLQNSDMQEIIENKEEVKELCNFGKFNPQIPFSKKCIELLNVSRSQNLTENETTGLLELLAITAQLKPKNTTNQISNDDSSLFQSLQSGADKTELRNLLDNAINQYCVRSNNFSEVKYIDDKLTLQLSANPQTSMNYSFATQHVSFNLSMKNTNGKNAIVFATIEQSKNLDIVPRNTEVFLSNIGQIKLINQCSASFDPIANLSYWISFNQGEIGLDVEFEIEDNSIVESLSAYTAQCGFLNKFDEQAVDEHSNQWQIIREAVLIEKISKKFFICQGFENIGQFAVIAIKKEETAKSNIPIIVGASVGAVGLVSATIIIIWWLKRKGTTTRLVAAASNKEKIQKMNTKTSNKNSSAKKNPKSKSKKQGK